MSAADGLIIVAGGALAAVLARTSKPLGGLAALVIVHFFLFCNVFRLSRSLELIWSGVLIAGATSTLLTGLPRWPVTLAIVLSTTVALVWIQTRKPSYHGVLWPKLNPNLRTWWDGESSRRHPPVR